MASPKPRGWVAFDGDYEVIGGDSWDTTEIAEAAASAYRDEQPDDEHCETLVAYLDWCNCAAGCWACQRGKIITQHQAWRSNMDD